MNINLRMPPQELEGATYAYLFELVSALDLSLRNLDEQNFREGSYARAAAEGGLTAEQKKTMDAGLSTLRSQIIKTAKIVRKEMDVLETRLRSEYLAVSDFGTYRESVEGQITALAGSIEQLISYTSEISDDLGGMGEAFDRYRVETEGYIKQGIIGYDGAVPVIGIAIGQDIKLTGATEEVDGKTYDVIDTTSNMSVWTPEKLAFYINGSETAYFSNGALNVENIIVGGKLTVGSWEISTGNGCTVRWIGS